MPVINIITFYFVLIVVALLVYFVASVLYNNQAKIIRERFFAQASHLNPTILKNIKMRYWTDFGGRTHISLTTLSDVYLFENCLAIVRTHSFIFKVFAPPILATHNVEETRNIFSYLKVYKPTKVHFNQLLKNQLDINLPDPVNKRRKIYITLKSLTPEQISQLEKIKGMA